MSLLTTPSSTEGLDHNAGAFSADICLWLNPKGTRIKSGDIFELQTKDSTIMPLPSFQLLELQWFLQRVVGMAGAAGPYDPDWNSDSDDEISNLGLGQVEDTSLV